MIKLTEQEKGYIKDFIECLKKVKDRTIEIRQNLVEEIKEYELNKRKVSYTEEQINEIERMRKGVSVGYKKEELIDKCIKGYTESLSDKCDNVYYSLFVEELTDLLKFVNNVLKSDKASFGGKKLKMDFLLLHIIEKDIHKGIISNFNDYYKKSKKNRKYFDEYLRKSKRDNVNGIEVLKAVALLRLLSREVYLDIIEDTFKDVLHEMKYYQILKEFYFDKKETFSMEDMVHIKVALDELEVHEDIKGIVINSLEKKIRDRKKKETVPVVIEKEVKVVRTFNEIQADLLKYYDFDRKWVIADSYITNEEVIYCITLLKELQANKGQMETFMRKVNEFNREHRKELMKYSNLEKSSILQEISKYYDIEKNQILGNKILSKEDIVNCVFLLRSLNVGEEFVNLFLKAAKERNEIQKQGLGNNLSIVGADEQSSELYPVQIFEDLYEKIEYYSTYFGFSNEFKEGICSTYELCQMIELNTIDDCEEYYEYQKILSTELNKILSWMKPDNLVNYEIEKINNVENKSNIRKAKKKNN